jgi:DNA-directed RNA polymerase III subunit RPC7
MSRGGGRGGGRGGRGGGGGRGGRPNVPWDTGDEPDARPSELFPVRRLPTFVDVSLSYGRDKAVDAREKLFRC